MSASCFGSLQVCGIRVARLQASGAPDPGATNGYVSNAMISINVGAEVTTGDDLELKNGCGNICQSFKDCDRLKRVTLSMDLCQVDYELIELLTGATLFKGTGGDSAYTMGFEMPSTTADCPNGVSFEAWTKAWDGSSHGVADTVDAATYHHWVFPKTQWRLGDFSMDNDILTLPVEGFGEENIIGVASGLTSNGPFNDWPAGVAAAGGVKRMGGVFYDSAPPDPQCGYIEVPAGS